MFDSPPPSRQRLDISGALRAMNALLENPDDTAQVFVIVKALSGNSLYRNYRRFGKTAVGRRVLREQRALLEKLKDHRALAELPEGSLGRAYLQFLNQERINAEGLVSASEGRDVEVLDDANLKLFRDRMRDMHDLWHVVTGYEGDLVGEAALLAFSFAQTWNPGLGFIALTAVLKIKEFDSSVTRLVARGFARGLRARWLPGQDWESLLATPLSELRARLRVGPPPCYVPIRTTISLNRMAA